MAGELGFKLPPRGPRAVGVKLPATVATLPAWAQGVSTPGLPAALKSRCRPGAADARGPTQTGGDLLGTARQHDPRRRPRSFAWQSQFTHLPLGDTVGSSPSSTDRARVAAVRA